jgi:hypothetical protein
MSDKIDWSMTDKGKCDLCHKKKRICLYPIMLCKECGDKKPIWLIKDRDNDR